MLSHAVLILEAGKQIINSRVIWTAGNQPKNFFLSFSPRKEWGTPRGKEKLFHVSGNTNPRSRPNNRCSAVITVTTAITNDLLPQLILLSNSFILFFQEYGPWYLLHFLSYRRNCGSFHCCTGEPSLTDRRTFPKRTPLKNVCMWVSPRLSIRFMTKVSTQPSNVCRWCYIFNAVKIMQHISFDAGFRLHSFQT